MTRTPQHSSAHSVFEQQPPNGHIEPCDVCSRPFSIPPSWAKRCRVLRCPECRKLYARQRLGICQRCGQPYTARQGVRGYCSFDCARKAAFFSRIVYEGEHWIWIGCREPICGYGRFTYQGKPHLTQHLTWRWEHGDPRGALTNQCGRLDCCNPAHWSDTLPQHKWRRDGYKGQANYFPKRPNRHERRKLSLEQYTLVWQRFDAGQALRQIATEFMIDDSALYCIKHGRTYRDWYEQIHQGAAQ